jgi:hypothetical protein
LIAATEDMGAFPFVQPGREALGPAGVGPARVRPAGAGPPGLAQPPTSRNTRPVRGLGQK